MTVRVFPLLACLGLPLNVARLSFPAEGEQIGMGLRIVALAADVSGLLCVVGPATMRSRDVAAGGDRGE